MPPTSASATADVFAKAIILSPPNQDCAVNAKHDPAANRSTGYGKD
jgi:hypothetical protein